MPLVSYTFYRETYLGALVPENEYETYIMRATQQLFCDTNGASAKVLLSGGEYAESVRLAVCAVAEVLYGAKNLVNGGVIKETAGTWSKTYRTDAHSAVRGEIAGAEALYLSDTGLLYKGRCSGV